MKTAMIETLIAAKLDKKAKIYKPKGYEELVWHSC